MVEVRCGNCGREWTQFPGRPAVCVKCGVSGPEADGNCPACWSPFVDCDGACGARICACSFSSHDCDEYLSEQPHEGECSAIPSVYGDEGCNCIKSLTDDERRSRRRDSGADQGHD